MLVSGRITLNASETHVAGAIRTNDKGVPVQAFKKQILRTGDIFNKGQKWTITPEFLDQVVATFSRYKGDGNVIPVLSTHSKRPDDSRGEVLEVWREGSKLYAKCEMIGNDAIMLASRAPGVSVNIENYEVDGKSYPLALTHLACCIDPAVPGMEPFVALAASLDDTVYRFSVSQGTSAMWKNLAPIFGLDASKFTDDTGPDAVMNAAKSAVSERDAAAARATSTAADNAGLRLSLDKASKGAPTIDNDILDEHADIIGGKLGGLVEAGIVTPAQKDKLSAIFTGEKGKRPALCLSRKAAEHAGLSEPLALSIINVLAEGKGRKPGEKTGPQKGDGNDEANTGPGEDFHALTNSFIPGATQKKK